MRAEPGTPAADPPRTTSAGSWAWLSLVALLATGSLLAWWLPANSLDWQPELALREPWRALTAAFVHWSAQHLLANLLAAAVVGAYGWAARLPPRATLAFALSWPLGHLALLAQPALLHYGGLSGMLHGGVATVSLWLVWRTRGARRAIGIAVFAGLAGKLLTEQPWGPPLRSSAEWDITVAPLAHATGALAGLLCAALLLGRAPADNAAR